MSDDNKDAYAASILAGIAKGLNQGLQTRRENALNQRKLEQADKRLEIQGKNIQTQQEMKELILEFKQSKFDSEQALKEAQQKLGTAIKRGKAKTAATATGLKAIGTGVDIAGKIRIEKNLNASYKKDFETKTGQKKKEAKAKLESSNSRIKMLEGFLDKAQKATRGIKSVKSQATGPVSLINKLKAATTAKEVNMINEVAKPMWNSFSPQEQELYNRIKAEKVGR